MRYFFFFVIVGISNDVDIGGFFFFSFLMFFKSYFFFFYRMQELKASLLDESTQMSATGAAAEMADMAVLDETSQSSVTKTNYEMSALDLIRDVTAETIFEYQWPPLRKHSEHYFLQEQVSEYLGVKSFKRRFPDVARRKIKLDERDFLLEMRVINETQVIIVIISLF